MSLADQIIEHGPVESHDEVPHWFEALTAAGINALRDELLELRRLRAAAEARSRFVADINFWDDEAVLRCGVCGHRIAIGIDPDQPLAELVRRTDEHTEECR